MAFKTLKVFCLETGMVAHTYKPSTGEDKARDSLSSRLAWDKHQDPQKSKTKTANLLSKGYGETGSRYSRLPVKV